MRNNKRLACSLASHIFKRRSFNKAILMIIIDDKKNNNNNKKLKDTEP